MPHPKLEFLTNEAGEKEGLGDAGIETFRDSPYAGCAREAGQNARDADEALPVRMTFNVLHLMADDFPAHDQLLMTLRACREAADGEKEVEFFENALRVATREPIPVLEIADFNTTGLVGPPEQQGTPFHSLLKATGVSRKESDTSGGSFGIGKNASFAVSDLQMVFYSTRYAAAAGGDVHAAQGKVKLVSHTDAAGVARRMTGYWGAPGFKAILDSGRIPAWMRRHEKGTSIYCMGFRETEDWDELMTASLVTNFFTAVHREEMVFEVGGNGYNINRNTVEGLLANEAIRQAAERSGDLPELEFATQLYRCLVSSAAEVSTLTVPGLGSVAVRVLTEPGMPRRIGFVRNGMLITDNLQHFGHPLARFPGSRDFIALVEPEGHEAQKLFKRLENPAHRELSAQRIADPLKRSAAEKAMKALGRQLRDLIRNTTGAQVQGTVVIDELAQFFATSGHAVSPPDDSAERDPETHVFVPPKPTVRKPVVPAITGGTEGGATGGSAGSGGTRGGTGQATGSGAGGRGSRGTRTSVELDEVRNVTGRDGAGQPRLRTLHFSPAVDGRISLTISATGLNDPEPLRLSESDVGAVAGDVLTLDAVAGQRQTVRVVLAEPYDGPVELTAVLTDAKEGAS